VPVTSRSSQILGLRGVFFLFFIMNVYAAEGGHLDVLKWLRLPDKLEGQCEWD
jgi:hypothetical protein